MNNIIKFPKNKIDGFKQNKYCIEQAKFLLDLFNSNSSKLNFEIFLDLEDVEKYFELPSTLKFKEKYKQVILTNNIEKAKEKFGNDYYFLCDLSNLE